MTLVHLLIVPAEGGQLIHPLASCDHSTTSVCTLKLLLLHSVDEKDTFIFSACCREETEPFPLVQRPLVGTHTTEGNKREFEQRKAGSCFSDRIKPET